MFRASQVVLDGWRKKLLPAGIYISTSLNLF